MSGTSTFVEARKARYLVALAATGIHSEAALVAGVNRRSAYSWRKNEDFAEACDAAMEQAAGVMEKEARRRGLEGVPEPVFHKGHVVGHVQRYSDQLLLALLKANLPDKYRERVDVKHSGELDLVERLNAGRRRVGA